MNAQEIVSFAEAALRELQEQQRKLKESEDVWRSMITKAGENLMPDEEALVVRERARRERAAVNARAYEVSVHERLQDNKNFMDNLGRLRQVCTPDEFTQHLCDLGLTREQWDALENGQATQVPGARLEEFFWLLGSRKQEWVDRALPLRGTGKHLRRA